MPEVNVQHKSLYLAALELCNADNGCSDGELLERICCVQDAALKCRGISMAIWMVDQLI